MAKNWTTKEIAYIKKRALLAETNQVLNVDQLAKKLSRTIRAVEAKIYRLQKDGDLPEVDRTMAFDTEKRPYTPEEDKRIISMVKIRASYEEISEALGRSTKSIESRIAKLRRRGKLNYYFQTQWSEQDSHLIVENIKFDENGYVSNYEELARITKKRVSQIQQKVYRLRKENVITIQSDKSKTSVKSKQAMNRFNESRFAQYKKEAKPVPKDVSQANIQIDTQSKVVQLIMTTVTTGTERIINFFTMDGELLTVKKEPVSSGNDTSH